MKTTTRSGVPPAIESNPPPMQPLVLTTLARMAGSRARKCGGAELAASTTSGRSVDKGWEQEPAAQTPRLARERAVRGGGDGGDLLHRGGAGGAGSDGAGGGGGWSSWSSTSRRWSPSGGRCGRRPCASSTWPATPADRGAGRPGGGGAGHQPGRPGRAGVAPPRRPAGEVARRRGHVPLPAARAGGGGGAGDGGADPAGRPAPGPRGPARRAGGVPGRRLLRAHGQPGRPDRRARRPRPGAGVRRGGGRVRRRPGRLRADRPGAAQGGRRGRRASLGPARTVRCCMRRRIHARCPRTGRGRRPGRGGRLRGRSRTRGSRRTARWGRSG
jgi:hypothetical protein